MGEHIEPFKTGGQFQDINIIACKRKDVTIIDE